MGSLAMTLARGIREGMTPIVTMGGAVSIEADTYYV